MSSVHVVVVWEWGARGAWLPHAPAVSRTLERAHVKRLTRVVLADAEPALRSHAVNLRTLTQTEDTPEGVVECAVRRACYSVTSPAGRGVRWEWTDAPPGARDPIYQPLPMEAQCRLEEALCTGVEAVCVEGWSVHVARMSARGPGGARLLRRTHQAPYPLARSPTAPPTPPARHPHTGRGPRIPQQHTGSSVHSAPAPRSPARTPPRAEQEGRARSLSPRPRDRKPGLARQILHNLNIFSSHHHHHPTKAAAAEDPAAGGARGARDDAESESARSTRRHSVDTVSTYLSHESKDSLQASVGELLNCSAGSDDVFAAPPAHAHADTQLASDGTIVGSDAASTSVCGWVRAVPCPQWGALCPACLRALRPPPAPPAVALTPCSHMLHLHCLNLQLQRQRESGEELHIECLVCGRVYGGEGGAECGAEGDQPAGSMAWCLQPSSLPGCGHAQTILVTYNFQSGVQGRRHPCPGAPYYAVGFPRHSVLPDDALGRRVLRALRACWERGALFTLQASRTTGREHVVAWRAAPPPLAPPDYLQHDAHSLLHAALRRLEML